MRYGQKRDLAALCRPPSRNERLLASLVQQELPSVKPPGFEFDAHVIYMGAQYPAIVGAHGKYVPFEYAFTAAMSFRNHDETPWDLRVAIARRGGGDAVDLSHEQLLQKASPEAKDELAARTYDLLDLIVDPRSLRLFDQVWFRTELPPHFAHA